MPIAPGGGSASQHALTSRKTFPKRIPKDSAADRGPEARAEERSRCRRLGRGALAKAGGVARCRGAERSEGAGRRTVERRRSGTPRRMVPCTEAEASLLPPAAADILSGASIADGASEPSTATQKNRRSGGVGVATPKNNRRRRTSGATRHHHAAAFEPAPQCSEEERRTKRRGLRPRPA